MNTPRPLSRRTFVRTAVGAMMPAGLAACATSVTGVLESSQLTARPGLPTRTPIKGAMTPLGLASPRDGYLYVPTSYTPATPMPLFVALHGAGGEGRSWVSYPDRAEAHGTIVLAPDSRGISWDRLSGGFGSDAQFLNDALRHVFSQCRVDASRIALGGFSDGASYALSMGLVSGDLFTHVVGYSPGNYWRAMPRTGQPPIFLAHGFRDTVLNYDYTHNQIVRELREAGYDVTFVTFDGNHTVPSEISEAALDWFLTGVIPPSILQPDLH